jgi:hypothetical protein
VLKAAFAQLEGAAAAGATLPAAAAIPRADRDGGSSPAPPGDGATAATVSVAPRPTTITAAEAATAAARQAAAKDAARAALLVRVYHLARLERAVAAAEARASSADAAGTVPAPAPPPPQRPVADKQLGAEPAVTVTAAASVARAGDKQPLARPAACTACQCCRQAAAGLRARLRLPALLHVATETTAYIATAIRTVVGTLLGAALGPATPYVNGLLASIIAALYSAAPTCCRCGTRWCVPRRLRRAARRLLRRVRAGV